MFLTKMLIKNQRMLVRSQNKLVITGDVCPITILMIFSLPTSMISKFISYECKKNAAECSSSNYYIELV